VGITPVGKGDSPVRLGVLALSDGKMPVGKIPVGKTLLGRIPVGKIPVGKIEPRSPPRLVGTLDDCVGCASEDEIPPVEPGMMNGPRIVVGEAELGSCEIGDALGETTVPGMLPVGTAGED
jgi:hypothetical protein